LNMERMATAMTLMGHIIPPHELSEAMYDSRVCLLSNREHFLPLKFGAIPLEGFQGCYLMHSAAGEFIRSGKVANRPFKHRLAEHQRNAMKPPRTKKRSLDQQSIYQTFPSRLSKRTGSQLGYFEDLEFFTGLSFSVEDPHKSLYLTNTSGIFLWEKSVLDHLKLKQTWLNRTLPQKQMEIVAYFCEFVYRLALSPSSNMDRSSTGFEGWL
jgi:hypothetical protein